MQTIHEQPTRILTERASLATLEATILGSRMSLEQPAKPNRPAPGETGTTAHTDINARRAVALLDLGCSEIRDLDYRLSILADELRHIQDKIVLRDYSLAGSLASLARSLDDLRLASPVRVPPEPTPVNPDEVETDEVFPSSAHPDESAIVRQIAWWEDHQRNFPSAAKACLLSLRKNLDKLRQRCQVCGEVSNGTTGHNPTCGDENCEQTVSNESEYAAIG